MMAGKSTQHLQSERGEPLVESVRKMIDMLQLQMTWVPMLDMQGLQGEMTGVVAQGNSNMELHREVLEVVESRDLPVNRIVTKEGGGAKEKLEDCFEG